MRKINKSILGTLVLGLSLSFFTSCEPVDEIGPQICPTDVFSFTIDDLILSGESNGSVDLSTNGLNIKADLQNEKLDWELEITSATASKSYYGYSKSVDVFWYGNSKSNPIFSIGEEVEVKLTIACLESFTKKVTITGEPNFKNIDASYGALIRDWDRNGLRPVAVADSFSVQDGWVYGTEEDEKAFDFSHGFINPSPLGGTYGVLSGNSLSENPVWYFGGTGWNVVAAFQDLKVWNTDSLYLNVYLKAPENVTNMDFVVTLISEVDNESRKVNWREQINWSGWKMISVKLSDLDPKFTDFTGTHTMEIQLGCTPEKQMEGEAHCDFIILTVGEPFFENE